MTTRTSWLGPLLALAAVVAGTSAPLPAQSVTGVVPNWGDLETWSRPLTASREVEHGLGLHLSGPAGVMLVSFAGRLNLRTQAPPSSLNVVMAPPIMSNPNLIRTPNLRFAVDDGSAAPKVIDATGSVRVDDPAPGAIVRSATATISAADFVRLANAKAVAATVFGGATTIRPDQIKAMKALADRVKLK